MDGRRADGQQEGGTRGSASPGESPRPAWLRVLQSIARLLAGKHQTMFAAVLLALGGSLLIGSWRSFAVLRGQSGTLAPLTGRATATLERAWWRIDFDPRPLGDDGTNWLDLATPMLCARLRVAGTAGPTTAVFCRERATLRGLWQLTDEAELAPGAPLPWAGADGLPVLELRFSDRAWDWLASHPPARWHLPPEAQQRADRFATSEAEAIRVFVDDPLRRLARAWSLPPGVTLDVALDPSHPAHAVPLALLREANRPDPAALILPAGAALGGALMWTIGLVLLLRGAPWLYTAVIVVASLALLPLWGTHVPRFVGWLWEPAGGFLDFFSRELVRPAPQLVVHEPAWEGETNDVAIHWSLRTSRWAELLSRLSLGRPPGAATEERIHAALVESVRAQAAAANLDLDGLPGTEE